MEKLDHYTISVATDDNPNKEIVVACINFAVMSTQGYFVNFLATSNSDVTDNDFGHSFLFEIGGNSWRHHHLGVFLLKAAHLVSLTISSIDLQDSRDLNSYWVVLQARNDTKDEANKFYDKIGFEDAGLIDQLSKLQEVFEDLPDLVEFGEKSVNDFIHFMWNNVQRDSLSVFSNYNGNFLPLGPLLRHINGDSHANITQCTEVVFPFSARKKDFQTLAAGLPYFYLPFKDEKKNPFSMEDFIVPNKIQSSRNITIVSKRDVHIFEAQRDTDKWLNNSLLDFIPKWLTLDGTTIASQHCSFVSCNEMQLLMFDNNQNQDTICFKSCINLVQNVQAQNGFETKWICFPINNGDNHWTFLAVLNMTYLQTAQKDKLTAFLYYDALSKKTSRDDCMLILQNKGIFNFIICANVMFGKPDGLPKQDLLNLLVSTETFSRIHVYHDDSPLQVDGYNCGVLVCLCMMEIALNLSHKFQSLDDFDIPDGSPKSIKIYDEGDVVFKRGTFFQLFLDRTSSSKTEKRLITNYQKNYCQ